MLDQSKFFTIANDLRGYFSQASPEDTARNQGFAREIIVRYGPTVIMEGFALALIADDLQQAPSMLALTYALNVALVRFGYVLDFVMARGNSEAKAVLATLVQTSTGEDICALAALLLADPQFADARLKGIIQERFNRTEGTSCRMALALALYQCGDDRQLKEFVRKKYLPDYESAARSAHLSKEEARITIASMLMPQMLKIVIEDCATDGRGFDVLYNLRNSSLPWKRKQYND